MNRISLIYPHSSVYEEIFERQKGTDSNLLILLFMTTGKLWSVIVIVVDTRRGPGLGLHMYCRDGEQLKKKNVHIDSQVFDLLLILAKEKLIKFFVEAFLFPA